jgi:protein-tyrosine phosphatase
MARLLDSLDGALAAGHVVNVHCWGGIGRTGTVIGCYLVRHGMTGRQALAEIARLRSGTPDDWQPPPETPDQSRMVLGWESGI